MIVAPFITLMLIPLSSIIENAVRSLFQTDSISEIHLGGVGRVGDVEADSTLCMTQTLTCDISDKSEDFVG
jgi:hypothetical protein